MNAASSSVVLPAATTRTWRALAARDRRLPERPDSTLGALALIATLLGLLVYFLAYVG